MNMAVVLITLLFSSTLWACPQLAGLWRCPSGFTLDILQSVNEQGHDVYEIGDFAIAASGQWNEKYDLDKGLETEQRERGICGAEESLRWDFYRVIRFEDEHKQTISFFRNYKVKDGQLQIETKGYIESSDEKRLLDGTLHCTREH